MKDPTLNKVLLSPSAAQAPPNALMEAIKTKAAEVSWVCPWVSRDELGFSMDMATTFTIMCVKL
jgi:predicted dithiol-disulfide oxidoreductase (DUF899 family)